MRLFKRHRHVPDWGLTRPPSVRESEPYVKPFSVQYDLSYVPPPPGPQPFPYPGPAGSRFMRSVRLTIVSADADYVRKNGDRLAKIRLLSDDQQYFVFGFLSSTTELTMVNQWIAAFRPKAHELIPHMISGVLTEEDLKNWVGRSAYFDLMYRDSPGSWHVAAVHAAPQKPAGFTD